MLLKVIMSFIYLNRELMGSVVATISVVVITLCPNRLKTCTVTGKAKSSFVRWSTQSFYD